MKIKLDYNKKYLLACSFGPDSMTLFSLLVTGGYDFEVAHVNYNMREESKVEEQKLSEYCRENHIIIHTKVIEKYQGKQNFQAWARDVRYQFFRDIILERGLDAVLTGHQQDDFIETYLMQKSSNRFVNYYGINHAVIIHGITVIRPLLNVTKNTLEQYCRTHQVPFSIDKSNLLGKYTRNRVRINYVTKLTVDERKTILKTIKELNHSQNKLNNRLSRLINRNNEISISSYLVLAEEEKKRIIYLLLQKVYAAQVYSKALFNSVDSQIKSGKSFVLSKFGNIVYFSIYNHYFSFLKVDEWSPYSLHVNAGDIQVSNRFVNFDLTGDLSKFHIRREDFPLIIRTFKSGDTYQMKNYQKSVNRMFIDMAMPKHVRLIWPLIVNHEGKIVYLPRYRKDFIQNEENKLKVLL